MTVIGAVEVPGAIGPRNGGAGVERLARGALSGPWSAVAHGSAGA
ncbi:hypothetical protein ACMHYB_20710 [Sorangium sp. So ce1128]